MFDAIALRYDLLNRVLSLGLDRRWRREAVRALGAASGGTVLDVATGTGDLALELARSDTARTVIGLDPSEGMLARAAAKVAAAGLGDRIRLVEGDALALPLEDASVDGATVAFGIRNVPDRPLALREMARVVRPGGRVVVLELNDPGRSASDGVLRTLARRTAALHVHRVVPAIGALLSSGEEYGYLRRSIEAFPDPAAFARMMEEAGLREVQARTLTFATVGLFVGRRAV